MKNLKTVALALLIAFSTTTINAQAKKVDPAKTKITWVGKKVTGQHEGTITLKEGSLTYKDKKIVGGKFIVDMTTINVTDLKEDQGKAKLEGHLKSPDFFGTEKFTTSTLVFKKIVTKTDGTYAVTADLTIKDKTNRITFDLVPKGTTATAKLTIDRTKFDIKYGSGSFFDNLGDKAISDNFELTVSLQL